MSEYYSEDTSGQVFQHGVTNQDLTYVVFEPPVLRMPVLRMPASLTPGAQWETTYQAIYYSMDGVELGRQSGYSGFHVVGVGSIDVPAGTFVAAEVLRTEQVGATTTVFRDWYAQGVGWIRRTDESGAVVQSHLDSDGGPTPTKTVTWGAAKWRYRE